MNRATATLERVAFKTSRELEYFTQKELVVQTGHEPERWPEVVLKELVDNALDAAEEHDQPVEIAIALRPDGITVADNGPGLPAEVLEGVLDFSVRVSSKDAYVTPTRGAQGNALKTVLAIPFVLSGGMVGAHVIRARGLEHRVTVAVDPLRRVPVIRHDAVPCPDVSSGTSWRVCWPEQASLNVEALTPQFLQLVSGHAVLNPHVALTLDAGGAVSRFERSAATCGHWRPNEPMSAHWFSLERFRTLVAAFVAAEADRGPSRTVRELVAMFRGLSGTAKQKALLGPLGLSRVPVRELVKEGDVDRAVIASLLTAMQGASTPVKPAALGVLGEAHLGAWLKTYGGVTDTVKYKRIADVDDRTSLPFVVEIAFAARHPDGDGRRLLTGTNWSPALVDPFRAFSGLGFGLSGLLGHLHVEPADPVTVVVHLACPTLPFTDRGKASLEAL